MHSIHTYGHFMISIFSGEITLDDHRQLAEDIKRLVKEKDEVFVISFIAPGGKHLQNLADIIKVFQVSQEYMKQIRRFYALKHHPVVSLISSVVSRILDIHANYVEGESMEALFECIERDAQRFPKLKASLQDWEAIKNEIRQAASH